MLALTDPAALAAGLCALESDINSRRWKQEHVDLLEVTECDAGSHGVTRSAVVVAALTAASADSATGISKE